ncbi:MAG: hypothetical protein ABI234_19760 [Ktedonobacteraceae bacterium]
MEKTYHLDLKTLLEYLRGKSAILRATVTIPKQRKPCQGSLYLNRNGATHCFIFTPEGSLLLEGTGAHTALSTNTQWLVRIDTEQTVEIELLALAQQHFLKLGAQADSLTGRTPRPKKALDLSTLQRFSAKQSLTLRTVLTMVNGERTVEQIKAQLRLPPELIEEALKVLRNIDVIE